MRYVNEELPLPVPKVVWFGQRYEAQLSTKGLPAPHARAWSPGREPTSLACLLLLHLLPVVLGWVGLEAKLTYRFSRHIHSPGARGCICVFVPDLSSFARW